MSIPNGPIDRNTFKDYCMRRLGWPVISINVDPGQVDDRVDDALKYFWDNHYDGSERILVPHLITEENRRTRIIDVDPNIIGISHVYNLNTSYTTTASDLFNLRYQVALNDLASLSNVSVTGYVSALQYLEFLDSVLSARVPFRYNKHTDKLHLDVDVAANVSSGEFILTDAYKIIDPTTYPTIWRDKFLQRYATALIKRQWGENLSLYTGIQMLGGVAFDGKRILDEAVAEIQALEDGLKNTHSMQILIG